MSGTHCNSRIFAAKIYIVETVENKEVETNEGKKEEKQAGEPARVLAPRGTLSRYVRELELAPGSVWGVRDVQEAHQVQGQRHLRERCEGWTA